jgi:hypothetical protein
VRVGIEFQNKFAAIPRRIYFLMEKEGAFRLIAKENALIAQHKKKKMKDKNIGINLIGIMRKIKNKIKILKKYE